MGSLVPNWLISNPLPKMNDHNGTVPFWSDSSELNTHPTWVSSNKKGPPSFVSEGPALPRQNAAATGYRCLVCRAFGNEDEFDSAILLFRALLRRGLTNTRGTARSVNALLSEVSLG